jgi:hypothetical protein
MAAFLRFANLPPDLDEAEAAANLDRDGLADRSLMKIVREADQSILWVGVPWERHIADAVARKFNGVFWSGRQLHVSSTSLFEV